MAPQQPAAPSSNPSSDSSSSKTGPGPGGGPVNTLGIIVIAAYTILVTFLSVYVLVKIWPHCMTTTAASVSQAAAPGQSATTAPAAECKSPDQIEFFWGRTYTLWEEVRLLLIVLIAGALGGLLHVIRSLFWYVGNRDLLWSWVLMYILLPFAGGLLALTFYLVVRGGFFPMAKADQSNPIGFAALALLIGLFSAQAGLKLKLIFETVFSPPPPGADSKPQEPSSPGPSGSAAASAPTITSISSDTGSTDGGDSITIKGTNFAPEATVQFGGDLAKSVNVVDSTTITATTPPHTVEQVDVVVSNPDGQSATLPKAFTYL